MIQVNLLPWREQARKRKKNQFLILIAGSIIFTLSILFFIHMKLYYSYTDQTSVNALWQEAINEAQVALNLMSTQEQETNQIILQIKLLASLKKESFAPIIFLQELPALIPTTISITKIKYNSYDAKLYGVTLSEAEITKLQNNISKSPYFNTPELVSIDNDKDNKVNLKLFQVHLEQKKVMP
jgi:type IV pilus assembly protein PilN